MILALLISGCTGMEVRKDCKVNAMTAASAFAPLCPVRIAVGDVMYLGKKYGHAQAEAFINGEWKYIEPYGPYVGEAPLITNFIVYDRMKPCVFYEKYLATKGVK